MYPNLLGQKAIHKLSDADMAKIIGVSRTAYQSKAKSGRFTPVECKMLCEYFDKRFEYLFAEDGDEFAS
jgi:DNA-binding XRE family transcriptional regulator